MAGKSKRKRGKHVPVKKGKSKQRSMATVTQQSAVAAAPEAVPRQEAPITVPKPSTPLPAAQNASPRYTYITDELRTIGILAGIMLIILVILFYVLP